MTPERWLQVKAALQQALEQEPSRRAAYLDELASQDQALHDEVQSLIQAHEQAGADFMSCSVSERDAWLELEPQAVPTRIGRHIGAYQLLEIIGDGGMGEVYRAARADDEYRKEVAIKLIRTGHDTEFVLGRFRSERQILASFEHPNIAGLLDGGTTSDGLPYFVLELVDGEPINQYCDRLRLDVTARLRLFLQVCAAVQYAHRRLVIHRDLKPNNILVNREGVPKLLDFGIAKIVSPSEPAAPHEPRTMLRLLTPDYASPEQMRGEFLTTASDVYSLGVILYELLTGHRPYERPKGASSLLAPPVDYAPPHKPSTVARRDTRREPATAGADASPSESGWIREGSPQRLSRRLRGDLDTIVLMALRLDPRRRYQSVEALAEDIRRHLDSLPVLARRDTPVYRAGKFLRRHSLGVVAAAAIFVALIAALGVTVREARIAEAQRARAEHRFNDLRQVAHALIFQIHDAVQPLSGATAATHMIVQTALRYLDSLSQEAAGDLSLQQELAAGYERLGDVQGQALQASEGDSDGAAQSYRRALALRESILASQPQSAAAHRDVVETDIKLSELSWLAGKGTDALRFSRQAASDSDRLLARDPEDRDYQGLLARGLLSYGYQSFKIRGDRGQALQSLRRAIGLLQRMRAASPTDAQTARTLSLAYTRAAEVLSQEHGGLAEALSMDERANALLQTLYRAAPDNADLAHLLGFSDYDMASVLIDEGELGQAEQHQRAALGVLEALSVDDPKVPEYRADVAMMRRELAFIALRRGQPYAAIALLQQALPESAAAIHSEADNAYFRYVEASLREALGRAYSSVGENAQLDEKRRRQSWQSAKDNYQAASVQYRALSGASQQAAAELKLIAGHLQQCDRELLKSRPSAVLHDSTS